MTKSCLEVAPNGEMVRGMDRTISLLQLHRKRVGFGSPCLAQHGTCAGKRCCTSPRNHGCLVLVVLRAPTAYGSAQHVCATSSSGSFMLTTPVSLFFFMTMQCLPIASDSPHTVAMFVTTSLPARLFAYSQAQSCS